MRFLLAVVLVAAACDGTPLIGVPDMATMDMSVADNLRPGSACDATEVWSFVLCIHQGCTQPTDAPDGSVYQWGCCYRREWVINPDAGPDGVCCHRYITVMSDAGPPRFCLNCGAGYQCVDKP